MTALAEGRSVEEACRFGNTASSITVTRKGAQSSIPDREETLEQMKDFCPAAGNYINDENYKFY